MKKRQGFFHRLVLLAGIFTLVVPCVCPSMVSGATRMSEMSCCHSNQKTPCGHCDLKSGSMGQQGVMSEKQDAFPPVVTFAQAGRFVFSDSKTDHTLEMFNSSASPPPLSSLPLRI